MELKWKEYLNSIWYRKFWIAFLALFFFIGLLLYSGFTACRSAKGQISLNYEGAPEGLNPNGTRFSIHDAANDELLQKVIHSLGLEDDLSAGELFDALSLYPLYSQSVDKRYIATGYGVSLKLDKNLPRGITASTVLEYLLQYYHDDFVARFSLDDSSLDMDWSMVSKLEYFELGSILKSHIKNLNHYLDNLIEESGMAQYQIEGESFRSLLHSVNNFQQIYLDKYIAFVQEKHLFREVDDYYNKLVYQRMLLNQNYKQAKAEYEIRRDVTKMYDKYMIAFVMVPMYDAKNGLYMSRTKIGIDNYTVAANTYSVSSGALAKSIDEIDASIDRTRRAQSSSADKKKADGMIENIHVHMDNLVQRIRDATKRYEQYRSKTDLRYQIKTPTVTQHFNVKKNLIYTVGFAIVLCFLFVIWDQSRGDKKA